MSEPANSGPRPALLPGTLDLIVLRTLQTMGPLHSYAIAARLQQVSGEQLRLNQGTLYPALVRLEQEGAIQASWRRTANNHEARYYALTRAGEQRLAAETRRWRQAAGLIETLLAEEA